LLWLAAPLTGLLVQPIIGNWSDNTWGPLGRRRPFFLVGALLSSFALILMPLSASLWMAAGLLWILDASINISMEPFRAFVADMLPDDQRPRGFAMQSFCRCGERCRIMSSSAIGALFETGYDGDARHSIDCPLLLLDRRSSVPFGSSLDRYYH
jgi:MFS family permease